MKYYNKIIHFIYLTLFLFNINAFAEDRFFEIKVPSEKILSGSLLFQDKQVSYLNPNDFITLKITFIDGINLKSDKSDISENVIEVFGGLPQGGITRIDNLKVDTEGDIDFAYGRGYIYGLNGEISAIRINLNPVEILQKSKKINSITIIFKIPIKLGKALIKSSQTIIVSKLSILGMKIEKPDSWVSIRNLSIIVTIVLLIVFVIKKN